MRGLFHTEETERPQHRTERQNQNQNQNSQNYDNEDDAFLYRQLTQKKEKNISYKLFRSIIIIASVILLALLLYFLSYKEQPFSDESEFIKVKESWQTPARVLQKFGELDEEYFFYRLKIWKDELASEDEALLNKIWKNPRSEHNSICVAVLNSHNQHSPIDFSSPFYSSVFAQKYSKYHVFIYNQDPVSQEVPQKLRDKVTLLHHGLEHFEECKDYDIVLPLNENGELIGDSAFRKLDATYQEHASTKVAYSRVLGFSQKHKVPFAKGQISDERVAEENVVQAFVGNFLWSFRSYQIGRFNEILASVSQLCSLEKGRVNVFGMAYKMFEKQEIRRIEGYSFYSDQKISDDADLHSCNEKVIEKETNLKNYINSFAKKRMLFEDDTLTLMKEEEINKTISEMSEIPEKVSLWNYQPSQSSTKKPNQRTYYSYRLFLDPDNQHYKAAEYYEYDRKYNMGQHSKQLHLCMISAGRNLKSKDHYKNYIDSLARQNYTNFKIIYIDDVSDDRTVEAVKDYVFAEQPHMALKIKYIQNTERIYSLGNRDRSIRYQCEEDDIVIDFDADDQLIGNQVFKLYNSLYQNNPNAWLIYTNSIVFYDKTRVPFQGNSAQLNQQQFIDHSLRINPFRISSIRSFVRKLYLKIDVKQFQHENGSYYKWVGDNFVYIALAQLSGFERTIFTDEYLFNYKLQFFASNTTDKKKDAKIAKTKYPFKALSSLESKIQKTVISIPAVEIENTLQKTFSYYDSLVHNHHYEPIHKKMTEVQNYEASVQANTPIHQTICSESEKEYSNFAYYLIKEEARKTFRFETYFYDEKYQVQLLFNSQTPVFVIIETFQVERHFEKCFDSLIKMDYIHETFIFLYDTEAEREFMSRKMFKAYPMLLEYSKFLPKRKYASVEAIQKEFIDEECILVQLPMQSRFVGSQAFKLLNKVFHDDPETKVVLAPSMMLINENKSEVREVGSEMVRSSEDVLNFHKSNNGLLAVKLEKQKSLEKMNFSDLKVSTVEAILHSSEYQRRIDGGYQNKFDHREGKIHYSNLLKQFKINPPSIKKKDGIKIIPNFKSFSAEKFWKKKGTVEAQATEEFIFKNQYKLGMYVQELPMCIIAIGKNSTPLQFYKRFLDSILRQKYKNYHLVFSQLNNNEQEAKEFESQTQKVSNSKIKLIFQEKNKGKNIVEIKQSLIRQNCKNGELVIDIDGDDELIGSHVLGLINANFQENPQNWFLVANSLYKNKQENMILATTTAKTNVTESCELFNYDKIIVYKRELFLNAVKNLRVVSDNHLKLILIQLSGQRKSYITQPLSFDFESDFYEEHSEKEKSGILHLMSYPYEQLKYESYNGFERKQKKFDELELSTCQQKFVFFKKVLQFDRINQNKNNEAQEINKLLDQVMTPINPKESKIKEPLHLYYRLKNQPNNERYLKAEYIYLNRQYDLDAVQEQLPICVVSAGRNLKSKGNDYKTFIDSMANLNYSNFRVVYTDDDSQDNTAEAMQQYLREAHPDFQSKFKVIQNKERVYSLANKNHMVRHECQNEDDIIFDVDADDFLLGRQFLKVLNSVYQKGDYWFVYGNYCHMVGNKFMKGYSKQIPYFLLEDYSYRRTTFATIGPRSFLRKLFLKISEEQFKYDEDHFYVKVGDLFIYDSLAELSGSERTAFLPQTPYFYVQSNLVNEIEIKKNNALIGKSKTPFQKLNSIYDEATKVPGFILTNDDKKSIEKSLQWYDKIRQKQIESEQSDTKGTSENRDETMTEISQTKEESKTD